jgi:hypothetical protein
MVHKREGSKDEYIFLFPYSLLQMRRITIAQNIGFGKSFINGLNISSQ